MLPWEMDFHGIRVLQPQGQSGSLSWDFKDKFKLHPKTRSMKIVHLGPVGAGTEGPRVVLPI